jgi:NAD(P)H-hydrate repair Nnr-like enzyme with NAD(P)H-hydrate dehydratase domain
MISSFVCQGMDAFDSALSGVYLHGKAADILKEEISEYGLLPSDIPLAVAKMLP